jgi:serine/threonine protein kinase
MESLGRYQIREELGRGGMGVVYRAYDPTLDREVAIKSVRLEGVDEAQRAALEERLSREAKAAAKLQHPNIVAVYDFFRIEDRAYIVMEYIKGSMLDAMISAGNPPTDRIMRVLRQAANALDTAHKMGIVHRDIKPGNILVDESGTVKITDFGIARMTLDGATQTITTGMSTTAGTIGYMAPEQIRGEAVDGRADQFSLGIVAFQLFSGRMPFQADTWIALSYKIIHDPVPKIEGLAEGKQWAIEKALAKSPEDRFANCNEFVDALAMILAPPQAATAAASAASPTTKKVKGKRKWWVYAAIGVAIVGGLDMCDDDKQQRRRSRNKDREQSAVEYTPAPPDAPASPDEKKAEAAALDFVPIPAGTFQMGSDTDEDNQKPRHQVTISQSFEMAATETTERQWNHVMGKKGGKDEPKVDVSWNTVQEFIARLNKRDDGYIYRLPTEAEWEYAARGGAKPERPANVGDLAWYSDNSDDEAKPVRGKLPNAFGLYDMLGNVWEWTADWYEEGYYAKAPKKDPQGAKGGRIKIYRGGAYNTQGMTLSAAWRFGDEPDKGFDNVGFRVVRTKR